MQNPRLRTVYRQRKWSLPARVRKIMALRRKIMALQCKVFYGSSVIVYYVPRQSSRCLYEDAEFNVWAEGEDDKTASEYKQLNCLGTYDTLSEIGKRKREFVWRGAKFKLRLIILRTCTCEVISHRYRNKLDVAQREGRGPGDGGPSGRSGGPGPPRGPFREVSLPLRRQAKSAFSVYFR